MTKTEYREYIQSEWWQDRRRKYLNEYGQGCEECGLPRWLSPACYDQDLSVDHLNYQHLWGELDEDLQALCRRCHDIKHFGRSRLIKIAPPCCEQCDSEMWDGWRCFECLGREFSGAVERLRSELKAANDRVRFAQQREYLEITDEDSL